MWCTPEGDRSLNQAEGRLIREAISEMLEEILEEAQGWGEYWPLGVKLFDELSWQQRLAMLNLVARALLRPEVAPPKLCAVNEAAVAAVFAFVQRNVDVELDYEKDPDLSSAIDIYRWRRLLVACQETSSDEAFTPTLSSLDADDWQLAIECVSDEILWDADYNLCDLVLDGEPSIVRTEKRQLGIPDDYYTTPAADLRDHEAALLIEDLQTFLSDQ